MRLEIIAQGSSKRDRRVKQWGLSVLVDEDVLFDAYANPEALESYFKAHRIDVHKIKHIVISHDHWDHTGGLWRLLEQNRDCSVYVCRKSHQELKDRITACGARLVEVEGSIAIRDGVFTTGEIEGTYAQKPIVEQSLVLKNGNTAAIVTGCSHPGILTILARFSLLFKEAVDMILGGLHLADAGRDHLDKIVATLKEVYRVRTLAPFHCTGPDTVAYFAEHLPEATVSVNVGDRFRFNERTLAWERVK